MLIIKRDYFRNYNCFARENTIFINNLKKTRLIPEIINSLKRLIFKFGHKEINIEFGQITHIYTYPTLPVAGIIQHFKDSYNVSFNMINIPVSLEKAYFSNPISVDDRTEKFVTKYMGRIWKFNSTSDIKIILNGILDNIRKFAKCEGGTLYSCEWGINEIMDNVLTHSKKNCGYIFVQLINELNELQVCIFDDGIGIYHSMKQTDYKPLTHADAISLAIRKGVKGSESEGQGNGMWGLFQIISENQGTLIINSGYGGLKFVDMTEKVENAKELIILDRTFQSTTVYFSIKLNKEIDFKKALQAKNYIDLYVEGFEDEKGNVIYKVNEKNTGTGTRPSGKQMRNEVINLNKQSKKAVTVDFSGVTLITSSFADEFIAKLLVEVGLIQFQNNIRIINLDSVNQAILNKAISERFHQEYIEQNEKKSGFKDRI